MQIHSLAQEVPKPGFPEAEGAPVGCSTLEVCACLTQLQGEAESWSMALGETPLVQAVPCTGIPGNNTACSHHQGSADDPEDAYMILEFILLP